MLCSIGTTYDAQCYARMVSVPQDIRFSKLASLFAQILQHVIEMTAFAIAFQSVLRAQFFVIIILECTCATNDLPSDVFMHMSGEIIF